MACGVNATSVSSPGHVRTCILLIIYRTSMDRRKDPGTGVLCRMGNANPSLEREKTTPPYGVRVDAWSGGEWPQTWENKRAKEGVIKIYYLPKTLCDMVWGCVDASARRCGGMRLVVVWNGVDIWRGGNPLEKDASNRDDVDVFGHEFLRRSAIVTLPIAETSPTTTNRKESSQQPLTDFSHGSRFARICDNENEASSSAVTTNKPSLEPKTGR